MALRYLIDGYNLIYAMREIPPGSWQEKRAQLLLFLRKQRPQGNNPVTVIFDSRQGMGDRFQDQDMTVIYTAGESADDLISDLVRAMDNPRALVVVSNDQGIRTMVKGTGARFMKSDEFLKAARPLPARSQPTRNLEETEKINEEFRKKWL